ncbi:uncharacterized protein BO87DRAFT_388159 [Aspergillus neoniger CBS 115656]|uniref:Uncharacterized protein n=1 Tax=Aspergillus neoniger (strain CBS 115656) TaxID=1448310 RepID=A0A318YJ55_ASPNB|nr:hypothetical protein BO87DRAFT_388159 [Aspergillus neoniger CBS 115656]PYH32530.1 hypothetical protein BO87DRAFT_388159 [Aspergillus neoniger CBS 115656]
MEMPRTQAKGINERPHSTRFAEDARLNVPSNEMMQGPWNVSVRKEKELFPIELTPISDLNQEDMHTPTAINHNMGSVAHAIISEPISAHWVDDWCNNICVRSARETIPTALSTWTNGFFANMA